MRERMAVLKREAVAVVDEARCIGCVRCIEVCPVDAIVGAQGLMHTVVEDWCIGCRLCVPPCPVDCIDMAAPRGPWTRALKEAAGRRGRKRKLRLSTLYKDTSSRRKDVIEEILRKR
jgi:Na+-translocating ferredoxin:NAD+ oxidoreductase subunit B